jgi:hypothetical protein
MSKPRWCLATAHRHAKFEDCVTEALWRLSGEGGHESETGDTDWGLWAALLPDFDGVTVCQTYGGEILIPRGSYVLYTNSVGFVWSAWYATRDEARGQFEGFESAFGTWLSGQEEEEGDD